MAETKPSVQVHCRQCQIVLRSSADYSYMVVSSKLKED